MDDLKHVALACDGVPPRRGDEKQMYILGGGKGSRRGHAGKDAIGFGHAAPDQAGMAMQLRKRRLTLKKKELSIEVNTNNRPQVAPIF